MNLPETKKTATFGQSDFRAATSTASRTKIPPWIILAASGAFGIGYYIYSQRPLTEERKEELKEIAKDPRRTFEEMPLAPVPSK